MTSRDKKFECLPHKKKCHSQDETFSSGNP